ncbi:MAG: 4-hydroxythreonine-4-phosphate dehydrogenase PdxA [Muribaculaceae bacterium]|nr:4-hydroxythreonine-4-phosphate dehydrogenase PdxA [Muribaculaceae bacterium]
MSENNTRDNNPKENKKVAPAPAGERKIKVGITHGDCNGIGYEVILKTFDDNRILDLCTPVVYGSAKIAQFYRKSAGLQGTPLQQVQSASDARNGQLNIINVVGEDVHLDPGKSTTEAGQAAFAALEAAVADLRAGRIDVLVTAPINKNNIQSELFTFPGHTEYLESSVGYEGRDKALMILFNDIMRVALVTIHTPISRVAEAVTKERILEKIELFDRSLREDFGIVKPRIAVLALNPHAGEEGLLGSEEKEQIVPAIEEAVARRIHAFGPYAADGFFGAGLFKRFDGVLAMYHDQGLAPFKALAMNSGVNFTAGLPYVRTSPDHGTGYDIAGKNQASPDSFRQAVYAAIDVYRNRKNYAESAASTSL